jgi:hypothetical protein
MDFFPDLKEHKKWSLQGETKVEKDAESQEKQMKPSSFRKGFSHWWAHCVAYTNPLWPDTVSLEVREQAQPQPPEHMEISDFRILLVFYT